VLLAVLFVEAVVFPGCLLRGCCFLGDFVWEAPGSADRLWDNALVFEGEQNNHRKATPMLSCLITKLPNGDWRPDISTP